MLGNTGNSQRPSDYLALLSLFRANKSRVPEVNTPVEEVKFSKKPTEVDTVSISTPDAKEPTGLSLKEMNTLLRAAKQVDLSADPGAILIDQLKNSEGIDPTLSGIADTYAVLNSTPKLASKRYSYQVKEAFSLSEETIAEYRDREGDIQVKLRDGKFIDLSFKDTDVQSRLNLQMPNRPHLKYIQTMLLPTLLVPYEDINHILVLGIGGGTLAKYYTEYYSSKRKTMVDLRPILFDVAQEHFMYVPDENTELVPGDASVFLAKARTKKNIYDIINIDIFIEGPSDLLLNHFFWSNTASVLSKKGVCSSNIWKGDYLDKYHKIVEHHKSVFNTVFEVLNTETEQVALCGSHLPYELLFNSFSDIKAVELTGLTGINFKQHINNVRRLK